MGEKMLNATYQILHTDLGNVHRNYCAHQMDSILSRDFTPLGADTIYLKTFEDMYKFIEATPNFKVNYQEPMVEGGGPFPPTSGLIGIWASNYVAYKKFLETDKEVLFIFEDDALISQNFARIVEQQINSLPDNWDVFTVFVPDDCLEWYNSDYDVPGYETIARTYQDWSCAGYAINRKGAQKAIDDVETNGINDPIDWYLFNAGFHNRPQTVYFNTYSVKPSVYRPVWLSPIAAVSSIPETTETV
jgi:Glycosyltransferase family 25 (LPS biosynthesis protein)